MTDNTKMRDDAIREAARNHAGDEYFNADRAHLLVSPYSGRIFDAGFDRAWQAAQSEQATELERLREKLASAERERDELRKALDAVAREFHTDQSDMATILHCHRIIKAVLITPIDAAIAGEKK